MNIDVVRSIIRDELRVHSYLVSEECVTAIAVEIQNYHTALEGDE